MQKNDSFMIGTLVVKSELSQAKINPQVFWNGFRIFLDNLEDIKEKAEW